MGNYTIKGLAKANECEEQNEYGLAQVWNYWLACNCCDKQSVNDFKRLTKKERQRMLDFLRIEYEELFEHIVKQLY
jgi:hypothetical protein